MVNCISSSTSIPSFLFYTFFFRKKLVNAVQDYIKGLNFNYRVSLRENKITYINAYATFIDKHTIECKDKNNNVVCFK